MNIQALMKQAKQMQDNIADIEKELKSREYIESVNEDKVSVVVNGRGLVSSVNISKELLNSENKEILDDLVLLCVNNALTKMNKDKAEMMKEATGGIQMPGMF